MIVTSDDASDIINSPNYIHCDNNYCKTDDNLSQIKLKITFINVNGLFRKSQYPDFIEFIENYDIIGITESNMNEHDELELDNFTLLKTKGRQSSIKTSGGITVLVKNKIKKYVRFIPSESKFVLWVEVNKNYLSSQNRLIIGTVYLPGENSLYTCNEAYDIIQKEKIDLFSEDENIILGGDFNSKTSTLNDIDDTTDFYDNNNHEEPFFSFENSNQTYYFMHYNNLSSKRCTQDTDRPNSYGYKLIDFCKNNNLIILNGRCRDDKYVGKTTCKDKSVIDYIIISTDSNLSIEDFEVYEFSPLLSDVHCPISITVSFKSELNNNIYSDENNTVDTNILDPMMNNLAIPKHWADEKLELFKEELSKQNITEIMTKLDSLINQCTQMDKILIQTEVDNVTQSITDKIIQAAKSTYGTYTINNSTNKNKKDSNVIKNKPKPWFNEKCKSSRKQYFKHKKHYNLNKTVTNLNVLRKSSKNYKYIMNTAIRKYNFFEQKRLKNLRKKDSRSFWKKIQKKTKTNNQPINDLYTFFKDLSTLKNNENEIIATEHDTNIGDSALNSTITNEEIIQAAKNLQANKASGNDFLINEYLKHSIVSFLPIYNKLFNIILDTGVFPSQWSIGIISPVFKNKGNESNPSNYRPITLLSCFGKLLTSILNTRLTTFLDSNNILNENQAGFRSNYSTTDHILTLYLLLEYMNVNKKTMYCAFMDLKNAYDLINRSMLFQKLNLFNVHGKFFNVLLSMYSNTKSCLKCNNLYTNTFECSVGIRQGENLSCCLFSIFLNDLETFLNVNNCVPIDLYDNEMSLYLQLLVLLYADDTVLLANNVKQFRKILKEYSSYCENWGLKINVDKSKIMIFGRSKTGIKFYINNSEMEIVKQFRYLGITFSKNRRFLKTIEDNASKGKRAMYAMLAKTKHLGLSISCKVHLFKTMVIPILIYGCEVWGFENCEILESVQNLFCRLVLKLNKKTPRTCLLSETGLKPLSITINSRMVNYWFKIMTDDPSKIVRRTLICMQNFYENSDFKSKWLTSIHNKLQLSGVSNSFITFRKTEYKQRLEDQFYQNWNSLIDNSNRTIFYRGVKREFGYNESLDDIDLNLSYWFFKFISSNHHLPIEKGRWDKTPLADRLCTLCYKEVGDEFHFLFNCQYFDLSRKKYIKKYFYKNPSMYKTCELFNSKKTLILTNLCKFIKEIIMTFRK